MTDTWPIDTTTRWNELHAIPRFSPRYPSESVIRWTFRNFPRDQAAQFSLLDIGAGAGRHAAMWAREGYKATATDVSPIAIAETLTSARQEGLSLAAEAASADTLPFCDESFDGVLSFGVLYYLPWAQMSRAIAEIWRVLRTGGKAFVQVKSDADSRCIEGERVGHCAYRVGIVDGAYWHREAGMVLTLLDRDTLTTCFEEFSEVYIDRATTTSGNGRFVDDEWLIQLKK